MITRNEIIEIGTFNKSHGVEGEISATFDCDVEAAGMFRCLICDMDGIFVPFFPEYTREKSSTSVIVKIDGIDSAESVRILVNKRIYVLKSEYSKFSEEEDYDDYPVDFFIGFTVEDETGLIGTITAVEDSTDNVLFIVSNGTSRVYVPAVDDFIEDINIEKKTITMSLPEGLVDMQ